VILGRKYRGKLSYLPATSISDTQKENTLLLAGDGSIPEVQSYWEQHELAVAADGISPVTLLLPNPHGPVPDNWVTFTSDNWKTMLNVNASKISTSTCPAPTTKLDDGYIQLSYVADAGRGNSIYFCI